MKHVRFLLFFVLAHMVLSLSRTPVQVVLPLDISIEEALCCFGTIDRQTIFAEPANTLSFYNNSAKTSLPETNKTFNKFFRSKLFAHETMGAKWSLADYLSHSKSFTDHPSTFLEQRRLNC